MFDFDIVDTKTVLGESGFYLHKSNEIVFLDLLDPALFIYSLENNSYYKGSYISEDMLVCSKLIEDQ